VVVTILNELLHTREYRLYKVPSDMTISEAMHLIKQTVPDWDVHYIEAARDGLIFRLESPLPKRML